MRLAFFLPNGVKLVSYFNRYPINDWVVFGTNDSATAPLNINGKKYDVFSAYKFAVSSPSYVFA